MQFKFSMINHLTKLPVWHPPVRGQVQCPSKVSGIRILINYKHHMFSVGNLPKKREGKKHWVYQGRRKICINNLIFKINFTTFYHKFLNLNFFTLEKKSTYFLTHRRLKINWNFEQRCQITLPLGSAVLPKNPKMKILGETFFLERNFLRVLWRFFKILEIDLTIFSSLIFHLYLIYHGT